SDTSALSRMRAFVSSWAERLPLRINSSSWARSLALNRTTYFLTAISFPITNHLHRCLAAIEIQELPSFSMTGETSFQNVDLQSDGAGSLMHAPQRAFGVRSVGRIDKHGDSNCLGHQLMQQT